MHERQRRDQVGALQVRIILRHLLGHEHALVNERAVRQAGNVKPLPALDGAAVPDVMLGALADHVELPLKREIIGKLRVAANEDLHHERLRRAPAVELSVGISRQPRPSGLRLHQLFKEFDDAGASFLLAYEHHADAVCPRRQLEFSCPARLTKNWRGICIRMPAPSPVFAATARAAMIQVHQNLNASVTSWGDLRPLMLTTKPRRTRRARIAGRSLCLGGRPIGTEPPWLLIFRHFYLINSPEMLRQI
jgi:hypothetical protein